MKRAWVAAAALVLAVLALVATLPGGRADLSSPEDTAFLWDGLYLGKQTFADVPYVSTPYGVVHEMIRMADVRADDVVYDLGCGDGRLVIEAARLTGCRGVGVDIDGELIALCRSRAKAAGVDERTRFVTQDFFETDVREATVMLIYLLPEINLRLRPKFLREMKPGSRVVSHVFDMGDWRPDERSLIGWRSVYLWLIPANVTGDWSWAPAEEPGQSHTLRIRQDFQRIRGELIRAGWRIGISAPRLSGDRISFHVEQDVGGVPVRTQYEGVVEGNTITGTVVSGSGVRAVRWHAVRDHSTAGRIDEGPRISELSWD